MISDVFATTITETGAVTSVPTRIRGVAIMPGASAGSVVLANGSGGTTMLSLATPASATAPMYVEVPGGGIRCTASIHATVTNATSVTVFWS